MTDNEIIKALECCQEYLDCGHCPLRTKKMCANTLTLAALDLINRQKAENERLLQKVQQPATKSEAIKEFAERLCKGRVSNDPVVIAVKTELKMMEE